MMAVGVMSDCDHRKVYSGEYFAALPPRWAWICSECLAEGADELEEAPATNQALFGKLAGLVAYRKQLEKTK
jgi:hypothetical protein